MPSAYKKKRNTQRKYKKKTNRTKKQYAGKFIDETASGVLGNLGVLAVPVVAVGAAIAVPVLGVLAATAAKNMILNKFNKWGYDQQIGIMINHVLEDIRDIFIEHKHDSTEAANVAYTLNIVSIRKYRYEKSLTKKPDPTGIPDHLKSDNHLQCLMNNQQTNPLYKFKPGPLVTLLRQTYSEKKFEYDTSPNSAYTLLENRKLLIKLLLKMIFGDMREYEAHLNPFAIKGNSAIGALGNLATTPLSYISRKTLRTANALRFSDKVVYKKLIDQLYTILNVKIQETKGKLTLVDKDTNLSPATFCSQNYFKKYAEMPINKVKDKDKLEDKLEDKDKLEEKDKLYMVYTGEVAKDLALYEILTVTDDEIDYLQNTNIGDKAIITFEDLFEKYNTKMKKLKEKKLDEINYKKYYDIMKKVLIKEGSIDSSRLHHDVYKLVQKDKETFTILFGEPIENTKQNILNVFGFFFYEPPPSEPIPVWEKKDNNPLEEYTLTNKLIEAEGDDYWTWSPIVGYKKKHCYGQTAKYTYIESQQKKGEGICIDETATKDGYENKQEEEEKKYTEEYTDTDKNTGTENRPAEKIKSTGTENKPTEENNIGLENENRDKNRRKKSGETLYQTQTNFRRKKKIEFSEKVQNVINSLQKKIDKMKTIPLCNNCEQTFKGIRKMSIKEIREYINTPIIDKEGKKYKPCLCKEHIQEFMEKIKEEKNKKGGTHKKIRKTRKRKTRKIV
jgi:hypothetical protein